MGGNTLGHLPPGGRYPGERYTVTPVTPTHMIISVKCEPQSKIDFGLKSYHYIWLSHSHEPYSRRVNQLPVSIRKVRHLISLITAQLYCAARWLEPRTKQKDLVSAIFSPYRCWHSSRDNTLLSKPGGTMRIST